MVGGQHLRAEGGSVTTVLLAFLEDARAVVAAEALDAAPAAPVLDDVVAVGVPAQKDLDRRQPEPDPSPAGCSRKCAPAPDAGSGAPIRAGHCARRVALGRIGFGQ